MFRVLLISVLFVLASCNQIMGPLLGPVYATDGRDHAAQHRMETDREFSAFSEQFGFDSAAHKYFLLDSAFALQRYDIKGESLYEVHKKHPDLKLAFTPVKARWPTKSTSPYTTGYYWLIKLPADTLAYGTYVSYWVKRFSPKEDLVIVTHY